MAPTKGNKRATTATAASPQKKSRVDPMFAGIVATLQGADSVSEKCREMLIAMTAPSLSTPKGDRHNVQTLGVSMIEEMLQEHKTKLIEAVEVARKELSELESSKSNLLQHLEGAKVSLEEKQAAKAAAHTAHEEAKAATKAAEVALTEATDAQTKGDAAYAALETEKATIESAYQEHFKTPMDANECPHHSGLKPFLETLGLEDSLISALPSSCVKTHEQRGGFDNLVLTELGKAFVAKIASLGQSIVDGASGISERKANVVAAEAFLETKRDVEKTAAADLDAALAAQGEADTEVARASEEWTTFEPRLTVATENLNLQDTKRMDFEEGAFKDFENLRDKEAPVRIEEEAAPLGA